MVPVRYEVPFCDLTRLSREITPHVVDDWERLSHAASFVGGDHAAGLEADLRSDLWVKHATTCANGTDALVLALKAQDIGPGDVVAIPNLTFWATYEAVVNVGATPLLIDVDPDFQLDLDELRRAHDKFNFRSAILVHLFGWATGRLKEFRSFCAERSIQLVEDGAQSFGVEVDGDPVLAGATTGTCSFYPAKVIGGAGDGGAVTCTDLALSLKIQRMKNHGRSATSGYEHDMVGVNSRMSEMQAAYVRLVACRADSILSNRRRALKFYREMLNNRAGLTVHMGPANVLGNGYLAVVTSDRRDGEDLARGLRDNSVEPGRVYPTTIADQPAAKDAVCFGELRASREFCKRVVNLPLFYGISPSEVETAAQALLRAS